MEYAEAQVGEIRSGRGEAKRPMVERASSAPAEPLLSVAINRLADLRHRIADATKTVEANVDAMCGGVPQGEDTAARPSPPVNGAVGMLLDEITSLDYVVAALGREVERLRGIA